MAFSFVVEDGAGDSDANSYCSVEYADDYVSSNTHLAADWDALDEPTKQHLLVRASKILDARFRWHGDRMDQDSGLRWPRSGVYDRDNFQIADDVIPPALQDATAEFASYLMGEDWTAPSAAIQFKKLQVDVVDVQYNTDYRRAYVPDTVVQILEGLGVVNTGKRPGFKRVIRS